jgi:hypothetical protein
MPTFLILSQTFPADVGHGILGRLSETLEHPTTDNTPKHSSSFFTNTPIQVHTEGAQSLVNSLKDQDSSAVGQTLRLARESEGGHIYRMERQWVRSVTLQRPLPALRSLLSDEEIRDWLKKRLNDHKKCYMIVGYKSCSDGEIVNGALIQKGYRDEIKQKLGTIDVRYDWLGPNFVHDETVFALEVCEVWDAKEFEKIWLEEVKGSEKVSVEDMEVIFLPNGPMDSDIKSMTFVTF